MLWSMMRLIFKTSSVTPDFFYVFNIILSFSNCSQSFKKICTWELLGANVLKMWFPLACLITDLSSVTASARIDKEAAKRFVKSALWEPSGDVILHVISTLLACSDVLDHDHFYCSVHAPGNSMAKKLNLGIFSSKPEGLNLIRVVLLISSL